MNAVRWKLPSFRAERFTMDIFKLKKIEKALEKLYDLSMFFLLPLLYTITLLIPVFASLFIGVVMEGNGFSRKSMDAAAFGILILQICFYVTIIRVFLA